jgi:hypothetical protein
MSSQKKRMVAILTWSQTQIKFIWSHTHKCNKFKEKLFSHIIQIHSLLFFLHLCVCVQMKLI